MAHAASDGMKFTNLPPMKAHQRSLDAKGGGKKLNPLQMPGQGGGEEMGGDGADPAQVVAEHGPANDVHVTHDHATGKHHVTSTHEDGHVEESDHGSAAEAHDHAKALSEDAGSQEPDELEGAEYE